MDASARYYDPATMVLLGPWDDRAATRDASADEISAGVPGTWITFDEFPQLGAIGLAKMQQITELVRSSGLRVVIALSDETQQ